jgi:hypothetical protein
VANVQLSGKAAAMSRGVIDDVSKRLVATFAENLEGIVGAPDEPQPDAPSPSRPSPPADDGLRVAPIAAGMAADRMRDPRALAGAVGAALLIGWLVGRRS